MEWREREREREKRKGTQELSGRAGPRRTNIGRVSLLSSSGGDRKGLAPGGSGEGVCQSRRGGGGGGEVEQSFTADDAMCCSVCIGMSVFPVLLVAVVGDPGSDYSVYGNSGHPGGI